MGRITRRMWLRKRIQRNRNRQRRCRLIRRTRNFGRMQISKNQSWRRFGHHQKITHRKQKLLSPSWRHQKKRGLRFRNLHHCLPNCLQSRRRSFSYLRRNLGRRSQLLAIIQTHEQLDEINHQSQKNPLNDRINVRHGPISQQRCPSWWRIIEQSQNPPPKLRSQITSWILRSRRRRRSRHLNVQRRKSQIRKHHRLLGCLIRRIRSRNWRIKQMYHRLIRNRCLRHLKKRQKPKTLRWCQQLMWSRWRWIPRRHWCQNWRIRIITLNLRKS